jgi:hypothetical protein
MTIRIPDNSKKFTITNTSDMKGNIWYTKNVNFDEEGYIKLSSRVVSLQSEEDDSDFDIPLSYGRVASGSFLVATADAPWSISADQSTGLIVAQDADSGVPTGGTLATFDAWGCWWQNRWYMSTATALYYKTSSTWTDASITATTSGKVHPIAVFVNKQTLCIGNGNAVVQIATNHATGTLPQLSIPADYEVVALSYVTNRMGIATKLSDSAIEQNQEAMFFVWDGASSSANAGYPVGSDQILGVVAYKSSWAVLTRNGRLLYFNGGGFDELASFPFYSQGLSLGGSQNRIAYGDVMIVEGDVIYLNISNNFNKFNKREEIYIENNPAGIWCYEPKVGLYHRYAPSISTFRTSVVTNTNVNTTNNILTATSAVVPETGNPCVQIYNSSDKIGGLTPGVIYYVIRVTSTEFKLATTRQNAIDNQPIDITAQAAGSSYFAFMNLIDFGLTLAPNRVGGIGIVSKATNLYDHLVFGGEYEDYNSSTIYAHGLMTVPQFENRGYFLTVRMNSQNIEDVVQKIFIKYRPLGTGDSIILKYKDMDKLGIPVTTPQIAQNPQCTWTSTTTFTTTNDLSDALTQFNNGVELECEVINGSGAGCMEQITGLTENAGTYTVTLQNEVIGVAVGYVSNVIINNYKYIGTVTSEVGWQEFPINSTSKYIMIKCELRGVNITVEELQVVSDTFKASK